MRRAHGFTLIELLVTVAVLGLGVAYMFDTVVRGNRAYVVIDEVAESQQSLRAVADLLERDVRHAGMMVPEGAALCGVDNTNAPDTLYVSASDAVDPGSDLIAYDGIGISGTNISGSAVTLTLSSLVLEPTPLRAAYDVDGDGTNDSDFRPGGGIIVIDLDDPSRGTICGTIDSVTVGSGTVVVNPIEAGPLGTASGTPDLVAIPAHVYSISNGDQLRRDGLLLAEGVEDLQFALFLDADGDLQIDSGETRGTTAGTDDYAATDTDMRDLREVRVNLVLRTRNEDEEFEGYTQPLENRAGGVQDGFRRRQYTANVMTRNVGNRL